MLDLTVPMVEVWFAGAKLGEYANDLEALKAASLHADSLPLVSETVEYELRRDTMKYIVHRRITGPDAPALGPVLTISSTALTVTLDRPASGPTTISRYELERLVGSTWTQIASGLDIFGSGMAYPDTGLSASTSYSYRARAVDTTERASEYSYSSGTTSAGVSNTAPVWQSGTLALTVQAGSSVAISPYCSDPEGDQITYTLIDTTPNDSTITVSLAGTIQTTTATTVGVNAVVVRASDGVLTASKTIQLTVTAAAAAGDTFYIESGVATYDGASNGVQPGDTVIIRAGTRGPLRIQNLNGNGSADVTVKNELTGIATISGSATFILHVVDCNYVTFDGSNYSGATYGIKVQRSSSSASATAIVKISNLCKYISFTYMEVDGKVTNWTGSPAPGIPTGIQLQHNELIRTGALAGQFQEGRTVDHCYIHNVAGEGIYAGPNYTSTSMPMKGMTLTNNRIEDTGRDAIQTKQGWEGVTLVEGNTIKRAGRNRYDRDKGQLHGISVTGGGGTVRNNKIYDCGESGIQCYMQHGPDDGTTYPGYGAYTQFTLEIYNNLIVNVGTTTEVNSLKGNGITVGSDSALRVPFLPHIYSNTIVDTSDPSGAQAYGINIGANEDAGFARNNLIVNFQNPTLNGNGSTFSENTTSSSPSSLFVRYDNGSTYALSDFHLLAATAAAGGTAGTHYSTTDIEGTTRVSPDRGCYEYV